jgi:hypothetical protein
MMLGTPDGEFLGEPANDVLQELERGPVSALVEAMWADTFTSTHLCADATGVLVQALEKCRRSLDWLTPSEHRAAQLSKPVAQAA